MTVLRIVGAIVLAIVLAFVGLVVYAFANSSRQVTLPAPTGPYAVGRSVYDFVDQSRQDPFGPASARRELSVMVWYPTSAEGHGSMSYLPADWQRAFDQYANFTDHLNGVAGTPTSNVRSHSIDGASLSDATATYPLLMFSPGLGLTVYEYAATIEDLASHGYVVAGVNPTYSTEVVLSGGRVVLAVGAAADNANIPSLVALWAQDLRFVASRLPDVDKFRGRLQLHIGYFGHSVGGAAATLACRDDSSCSGAVDLDGDLAGDVLSTGLGKPFMFLAHDDSFAEEPYLRGQVESVSSSALIFRIKGSRHLSFSDRTFLFNISFVLTRGNGTIDPIQAVRISSEYIRAFFDALDTGRPIVVPANPHVARVE